MDDVKKTHEQRVGEVKQFNFSNIDFEKPYVTNLNEDP